MSQQPQKEPEIVYEHLLPSGRGIRFVRIDSKLLQDITERAMNGLPPDKQQSQTSIVLATGRETLLTCLRGVTHRPIKLATKPVSPEQLAAYETAKAAAEEQGVPPPPAPTPQPDLETTFKALREQKGVWRALGYLSLSTPGEDNLYKVLSDPDDWEAALERIGRRDRRGLVRDPFRGLDLTRST